MKLSTYSFGDYGCNSSRLFTQTLFLLCCIYSVNPINEALQSWQPLIHDFKAGHLDRFSGSPPVSGLISTQSEPSSCIDASSPDSYEFPLNVKCLPVRDRHCLLRSVSHYVTMFYEEKIQLYFSLVG